MKLSTMRAAIGSRWLSETKTPTWRNLLNHSSRTTNISEDLAARISPAGNTVSQPQSFVDQLRRTWRWWLGPAAASLILALIFVDPFIGDWDGLDYTVLAVHGRPSSMAL